MRTPEPTTSTLQAEPTPSPAATPLPAGISAIVPTNTYLPVGHSGQVSNLLFLSDSELIRWDPATEESVILSNGVAKFASSLDGGRIAVLRSRKIAANASLLYDLNLLEPAAGLSTTLVSATPDLPELSISPDGRWVAYLDPEDQNQVRKIYFRDQGQPARLNACESTAQAHCTDLLWSNDSRDLLWSDRQGIWVAHESQPARLAVPAVVHTTDPQGESSQIQVAFRPIRWSPAGRFILVEVIPSTTSVHWLAVADSRTGQVVEVPGTYTPTTDHHTSAAIGWLKNGSLAVAMMDSSQSGRYPNIIVYDVIATHGQLLVPRDTFTLFGEDFLLSPTDHPGIRYSPGWLNQVDDEELILGLLPSEDITPAVLVVLNIRTGHAGVMKSIPPGVSDLTWSSTRPDVVFFGQNSEIIFLAAASPADFDLKARFGNNLHDFCWVYAPDPT